MEATVTYAKRTFLFAGVYGLVVLLPQYFMEASIGRDYPPPVTHPEHFYGFLGTAVAWQLLFLLISRDPVRYRPAMLPAVVEKVTFGGAAIVLFLQGRLAGTLLFFGLIDLMLAGLFLASYRGTPPMASAPR